MIKNGRCRVPYQGYAGICHFVLQFFCNRFDEVFAV